MSTDAVGGVWTHALDLAAAWASRGMQITLAVLGPGLDSARRVEVAGIAGLELIETGLPLDWLARSPAEVVRAGCSLAAVAERCGAEIVQLNSPALAADIRFPCPVLGVCHSCLATWWGAVRGGAMPADFTWRTALLQRGYGACDALAAPSHAFATATARTYALPTAPEVVWNGRRPASVPATTRRFVFTAGRLWDEGKDLATLDRAAARLDMPVFAAGPTQGPHGMSVELPHLCLLGSLPSGLLADWLARSKVFVSTSRYEPFGLAVLEAAQAGCALVLSDIPTYRELWNGAAVFVAPGDDAGLAAAVVAVMRDQEQRRCLRVAAQRRAQRYSAGAMAEGMARIHARLLSGRAARGRSAAA